MRIHLRVTDSNPAHTRFIVFVNGASAGNLVLRNDEFQEFREIVAKEDNRCLHCDAYTGESCFGCGAALCYECGQKSEGYCCNCEKVGDECVSSRSKKGSDDA